MKQVLKSVFLFALLTAGFAGSGVVAEEEYSLPAIQGYDLVSYHQAGGPVRGNGYYYAQHEGVLYLFASEENRNSFQAEPGKYLPAYNGYCAMGVAKGKKFIGDPLAYKIVDGRLYLNVNAKVQEYWLKDVSGNIADANDFWPDIKDRSIADLLAE